MMVNKKNFIVAVCLFVGAAAFAQQKPVPLKAKLKTYVDYFNSIDTEAVKNFIPNVQSYDWLAENVPLLECPDEVIEKNYYYRWWSYRKHLVKTPEGFIFTEFIEPVKHAGKYNSISCALGHHIYEGRWLKNNEYLKEYINFWLYKADVGQTKQRFHQFSSWVDDAVLANYMVKPDAGFLQNILPALDVDYQKWEKERQLKSGLFWQHDVKDGMEESISGSRKDENRRPTINSYMYGNAKALATIAALLKEQALQLKYEQKAARLKKLVQDSLWNPSSSFFETKLAKKGIANVREAIGFTPWDFNLPDDKSVYATAWNQLLDTAGFNAPWGLTTAERRNPTFRTRGTGHSCEWDGALWPFASSQTLKGLSNLLVNYKNHGKMTDDVFYDELHKYALSHQKNGKPYIGEYQDEKNGEWLKGDNPRSSFYNHSTFCDLIISDLIGLKPRMDNVLEVYPLIPQGKWDWFKLENVSYHGKIITLIWDKNGSKYNNGKGFFIYADGDVLYKSKNLKPVKIKLS
ncbi:glycosyl hydrolase family 65 protein [Pedobacter sp. Leaf194]|uniref:MGH1-like glycoside hydrolase domain-containing protein n=1 Tax=Pedobacter sp. Leaf194 TaxID=1736297 RepID=UPI000702B25D|nr:glycosyl hydrolase family 65 protein [Pedobacter sp. Leaf194]KQS35735.1 glycoside hydrolase [Pedobacter sp. Leaf194]